jgi:hypothetical protein
MEPDDVQGVVASQVARFMQAAWKRDFDEMSFVVDLLAGLMEDGSCGATSASNMVIFFDGIETVAASLGVSPFDFFRELGWSGEQPSVRPAEVLRPEKELMCGELFDSHEAVVAHYNLTTNAFASVEARAGSCGECGARGIKRMDLHRRVHTLPVACSAAGCARRFACAKDMKRHVKVYHPDHWREEYFAVEQLYCACGAGFTRTDNLSRHRLRCPILA